MRLSTSQIEVIKRLAKQSFGEATQVRLFGSRVDDSQRGGDIDLYVEPADTTAAFAKKLRLTSLLQRELGEQKFDIVIARDHSRTIERAARAQGIVL